MDVRPVTLAGRMVRLEPLDARHVDDLAEAGSDPETWRYMSSGTYHTPGAMARFVATALAGLESGRELPFAVVHLASGRVIGSTRYMDIRPEHRGLEIGGTWYAPAHCRTGVNTECKTLLLEHAFESLECLRIQLKTDVRNERSRRAIERIGGVFEGVLRDHMILPDGFVRSTAMYSIVVSEWPATRDCLARLCDRNRPGPE